MLKKMKSYWIAIVAYIMLPAMTYAATAPTVKPITKNYTLVSLIQVVLTTLLAITGLIAVIYLVIGGLKYVTSGGNKDSVAAAKNTILYAIIGIIVILLAYVIVNIIVGILTRGTP
jgi:type IV secretory pathway TrbL component